MNKNLLIQLVNWPKYYISGAELRIILPGESNSRKAIIKRAIHEGFLERVKRNLYLIKNIENKPPVNAFEMAQFVYGPSYISFESALSYYGWIPEAVPVICSATVKQSKEFNTHIATFSYEKIPNKIFSVGVMQIKEDKSYYLIANPWKAVADMNYTRKKNWSDINEFMGDLRIELASLINSNIELLNVLSQEYPHKLTRKVLKSIFNSLDKFGGNNNDN